MVEESAHHAVVMCTKAVGLRARMRQYWELPAENLFRRTGPKWLFTLLSSANKDTGGKILLLLWWAWYLRNDMTHNKGLANVAESAEFLISYAKFLGMVHGAKEVQPSSKGKEAMDQED
jgi:hypothetical protein